MTKRGRVLVSTALGALALAVSGCASVGPEEALAPVAVPAAWTAVSDELSDAAPVTRDWLADLSDPSVAPLVAEAIAYNNNLASTAARVRALYAQAGIQRSLLLPTVSAGLSGSSQRSVGAATDPVTGIPITDGNGQPLLTPQSSDGYQLGFDASWEIDLWGAQLDATRAAYLDAESQRLTYAAAALSVAGGAAQRYYGLTEAKLQRQLAERDVETGEANLRIVERRYDRGISSALDVRLARASLAQSRAQLIAREQTELEAARGFEVLLGRYPRAEVEAAEGLPDLDEMPDRAGGGDPLGLLARRPDVIASELSLKAAGLRVSEARKAFLPALRLTGSATNRFDNSGSITFDPDDVIANLFASLTQPLFQGGRLRASLKAQRAQQEAALYAYADTMLSAFQEVENALAAERLLAAQLAARRLAFEEAEAAETLTERQYLTGTANIFDLISAQQRRISSESQFIAASRARLNNRIALYLALGAPFEAPSFMRDGAGPRLTPPGRDPALDGSRTRRSS